VPYFCLIGQSSAGALSRLRYQASCASEQRRWLPVPPPPRPSRAIGAGAVARPFADETDRRSAPSRRRHQSWESVIRGVQIPLDEREIQLVEGLGGKF